MTEVFADKETVSIFVPRVEIITIHHCDVRIMLRPRNTSQQRYGV